MVGSGHEALRPRGHAMLLIKSELKKNDKSPLNFKRLAEERSADRSFSAAAARISDSLSGSLASFLAFSVVAW